MTKPTNSDVLILGGGPAGYSCALRASQLGLSVTLIEADRLGGTCLHRGCIPTKALLHTAEVADAARTAAAVGVRAHFDGVDMVAAQTHKNAVVARLHSGLESLVADRRVSVLTGTGRYLGDRRVEVDGTVHRGDAVVLATGSTPRQAPRLPFGGRILCSDQALELTDVPRTAVVVGGGVIGVEFASMWTSLGSSVTVIESLPHLLAGEDAWVADRLERALRSRGVTIRTGVTVTGASQTEAGVTVGTGDGAAVTADVVLVAVGRQPNSAALAEGGIVVERGFVRVDDRLSTNHPGVYAIGDLVAGRQLAHRGFAHGIFAAEMIAGHDPVPVAEHLIPRVTYSNPEVASVGLTEAEARTAHGEVSTVVYDLNGNSRSQILRVSGGVKVIRRGPAGADGPVLGIHCVGDRVGELIGEAQLIVGWEATPADVRPHLHAHPTQNEALGEAMLALAGAPLHRHS
ncbi:dihydrolipoyl dehydrogenase [Mycobacterium sp. ACS4331]|uniref:dihydrolipoyl dehydrogenase n=1 Tax=Mycobacterium sp. ACS4331 TaxID=1834121 RepID=UPI0007FBE346|nr:dihydrolipoyl dehydrogenase [Mycobacterium sp. ACS4331]OBF26424.1 dihydrolipoyl dehydrogenase [Mycobacterium sp. ACS4331]